MNSTAGYNIILFTDMNGRFWHAKTLGAYRLATELRKHGYSVKVVDYFGQWLNNPAQFYTLLKKIVGTDTLFIGFSSVLFGMPADGVDTETVSVNSWKDYSAYAGNLGQWPVDLNKISLYFKFIRSRWPHVKLVYGGTSFIDKTSKLFYDMDYIVLGLADSTIVELADHIKNNTPIKYSPSGWPTRTRIIDYDMYGGNFDFPTSTTVFLPEDIMDSQEIIPMETSRGCLFRCSFCRFPLLGRKKGHPDYHKTVETMAQEFRYNWEQYGSKFYNFVDDTFNETTEKIENILRARDIANVEIEFTSYLRSDLLARFPEQIRLLKELGIRSCFLGIESLYYPSAIAIGKSTKTEKIKETLYKIKEAWQGQAVLQGGFIIGLPEDNPDTLSTWIPWIEDKSCPLDGLHVAPLFLIKKNDTNNSLIELDLDKYGYKLLDNGTWTNQYWDKAQATDYANALMQRMWDSGRLRLSGFDYLGYKSIGYTDSEILNTSLDKVDYNRLQDIFESKWKNYCEKILSQENIY